jgi:hypothetical protein
MTYVSLTQDHWDVIEYLAKQPRHPQGHAGQMVRAQGGQQDTVRPLGNPSKQAGKVAGLPESMRKGGTWVLRSGRTKTWGSCTCPRHTPGGTRAPRLLGAELRDLDPQPVRLSLNPGGATQSGRLGSAGTGTISCAAVPGSVATSHSIKELTQFLRTIASADATSWCC